MLSFFTQQQTFCVIQAIKMSNFYSCSNFMIRFCILYVRVTMYFKILHQIDVHSTSNGATKTDIHSTKFVDGHTKLSMWPIKSPNYELQPIILWENYGHIFLVFCQVFGPYSHSCITDYIVILKKWGQRPFLLIICSNCTESLKFLHDKKSETEKRQ